MGSLNFYVEFNIEIENIGEDFKHQADQRLWELAKDNDDVIGASVALENIVKVESPFLYQVRIVIYKRPENIAVIEKAPEPMVALRNALDKIERRIRESREKLSEAQLRKADDVDTIVLALSAREVYDTYGNNTKPAEFLSEGRNSIAGRLMVEHGLSQIAAYSAADKLIWFAYAENKTS